MDEYICFTLDNSLAAVSAALAGGEAFATDGSERLIYRCAKDGSVTPVSVKRPYRRLRLDASSGGKRFTALGGADRRLYHIGDGLAETGYTDLSALNDAEGAPIDAGIAVIDGKHRVFAAYADCAYLTDMCGAPAAAFYTAPRGAELTDFAAVTAEYFAAGYIKNGMRFVSVAENGREQCSAAPEDMSLRMLIVGDDGIYALFGSGYIYNRIYKIYSNGKLVLPKKCIT